MNSEDLKNRTMEFAIRILKLAEALPDSVSGRTVARQVARSGCSVAANYRSALRGKSRADFTCKITTTLEEADETEFWIELTERAGLLPPSRLQPLRVEANELVRIFNATRMSTRNHKS